MNKFILRNLFRYGTKHFIPAVCHIYIQPGNGLKRPDFRASLVLPQRSVPGCLSSADSYSSSLCSISLRIYPQSVQMETVPLAVWACVSIRCAVST